MLSMRDHPTTDYLSPHVIKLSTNNPAQAATHALLWIELFQQPS
jgi:hypothetical protein